MTASTRRPPADAGFTLTEMLVAIGISALLIVLVTGLVVRGLSTFRTVTAENNLRAAQENASLWLQGIIRFADNPVEATLTLPAFDTAGVSAMTVYSFGAPGTVTRVPYKVTVATCAAGDSGCAVGDVISKVSAPTLTNGAMTYDSGGYPNYSAAVTRVLVPKTAGGSPTLTFTYRDGSGAILGGCAVGVTCTPSATIRDLQPEERAKIARVDLRITYGGSAQSVDQTIALANPI